MSCHLKVLYNIKFFSQFVSFEIEKYAKHFSTKWISSFNEKLASHFTLLFRPSCTRALKVRRRSMICRVSNFFSFGLLVCPGRRLTSATLATFLAKWLMTAIFCWWPDCLRLPQRLVPPLPPRYVFFGWSVEVVRRTRKAYPLAFDGNLLVGASCWRG